jgi:peptidyl-prolyl cis-trans isomerase D
MLAIFRKASQTTLAKIFFGILTLAFSTWGISDVVRTKVYDAPAISIGDTRFSSDDVLREFKLDIDMITKQYRTKLSLSDARQAGLLQQTIDRLVQKTAMSLAVTKLGLTIDDDSLRKRIEAFPAFQNQFHQFDKLQFITVLRNNNLSEIQFIKEQRDSLSKQELMQIITSGLQAPLPMVTPIAAYRYEQRIIQTLLISPDNQSLPSSPDDETLKTYFDQHHSLFMAPEYRSIHIVSVREEDLMDGIKPSDSDIQKAYDIKAGDFIKPEKRTVRQILFDKSEQAQSFMDQIISKKSFDSVAQTFNVKVTDLGSIEKKELPFEQMAQAVFSASLHSVVGPVETPLGFSVLEISAISPSTSRPLQDVKSQLIQSLIKEEATNRLYAISTKLEDSIGAGASIEETANALNIISTRLEPFDEKGMNPLGNISPVIAKTPDLIASAFTTAEGTTSDVTSYHDNAGYFALHVDKVIPTHLKDFTSIKSDVLKSYNAAQQVIIANKKADDIIAQIHNGIALSSVAVGQKIETSKALMRNSQDKDIPTPVLSQSFKLNKPGDTAVVHTAKGPIIIYLKEIIPASIDEARQATLQKQLSKSMTSDLLQEFIAQLQKDYSANINYGQIDKQFSK